MKRALLAVLLVTTVSFTQAQWALYEDFNACALPAGWTSNIITGVDPWLFVLTSPDAGNAGNIDGSCMCLFDDDAIGGAAPFSEVELLSPVVDMTSYATATLEFDYNYNWLQVPEEFRVDVFDGTAWVTVLSVTADACGTWTCGPPYPHANIDVTPFLNASFQMKWVYDDGDGFQWYVGFDNVLLSQTLPQDVGVSEIVTPMEACALSASETVSVEVTNYGTDTASSFDVFYRVDAAITGPEIFTDTLAPGESGIFTFAATADMSAPVSTDLASWTGFTGDLVPENDSTTTTYLLGGSPLPIEDNFDSYIDGTTVFPQFENDPTAELNWEVNFGATSSGATGPNDDVSGGGGYIYMETSGSAVADRAILRSECVDLSSAINPQVRFGYHMAGASIGYLRLDIVAGGSTTTLVNLIGAQQALESDPWLFSTTSLTPYIGQTVEFIWTGEVGTGGSTFQSDIAIDEIRLIDPVPDDLGVILGIGPMDACDLSSAESLTFEIKNFGLNTQTGFDVAWQVTGPIASAGMENVGALSLDSDSTAIYTTTAGVDLSVDGLYTVKAWTVLPSDALPANDTVTYIVENITAITSYPWVEDFETFTVSPVLACNADASATVANGWTQDQDDDQDWLPDFGGTSSFGTGPAMDFVPGTTAGKYLYTEASGCINQVSRLTSPCMDISALPVPGMEFYYHMFGTDQGTLAVEVSSDGGASWTEIWSRSGPDQVSDLDPWIFVLVSLAGHGPNINLRFVGTTGAGLASDMAIDAVKVYDIPPFDDLQVINVFPQTDGCTFSTAEPITVVIQNSGTTDQTGFDVSYDITGPIPAMVTENVGSLNLLAGTLDTFTFVMGADFSLDGTYSITAATELPTDTFPLNDDFTVSITNTLSGVLPIDEDFNTYPDGTVVFPDFVNSMSDDLQWEVNYGGTSSTATGPTDDVSGGGGYIYMETSGSSVGDEARLATFCLDLAGFSNPRLKFAYHMYGEAIDFLKVDVLAGDSTTNVVSIIGEQQTANADPWFFTGADLTPWIGSSIFLRFTGKVGPTGSSFNCDISLDEIKVRDVLPHDIGVSAVLYPTDDCDLGVAALPIVSLENFGANTETGFNVAYEVSGPTGTITGSTLYGGLLEPDSNKVFTITDPFDASVNGIYTIAVWTELGTDGNLANDTMVATFENITGLTPPFGENFDTYPDGTTVFPTLTNDPDADQPFEVNYGPTGSFGTGPNGDASSGGLGGYIYMEGSFTGAGEYARICTECLDLTFGLNPRMEFAYHMFGANIDRLNVDVLVGGVSTTELALIGQQQFANTDPWLFTFVDLTSYLGQEVRICWEARAAGFTTADIAIDEIRFRDPFPDDIGVVDVTSPDNACELDSNEAITVVVENFGVNTQFDFFLSYSLDGGPTVTELVVVDSLIEDDTVSYTFTVGGDFSADGSHFITAWTDLAADTVSFNDTLVYEVVNIPSISTYPYVEDFELGHGGWTSGGMNSSWEVGAPAGDVINSAASGVNAVITNKDGDYNNDEDSYMQSVCYDFSSLVNPGIKFNTWWDTEMDFSAVYDGTVLQSTVDDGTIWKRVGDFGDPDNWYNQFNILGNPGDQPTLLGTPNGWGGNTFFFSGPGMWVEAMHALDGLAGEPGVILRYAFASDASIDTFDGYAFDDVIVADMPSVSLGPDTTVCAGYLLDAANPGDKFLWNTGDTIQAITVVSSGLYSVTVTDTFGFKDQDEVLITIAPTPSVDLGPDGLSCVTAVLDAGNPGSSYFWNTGEVTQSIGAAISGTYWVTVTDPVFGCIGYDTVSVTIESEPEALFTYTVFGATVDFLNGSPGATTYDWDFGDGATSTDEDPAHVYTTPGNYTVTLIACNDCGCDTMIQSVAIFSVGVEDVGLFEALTLYPNPTDGFLQVGLEGHAGEETWIGVFDASGAMALLEQVPERSGDWKRSFDFTALPQGQYLLKVFVDGKVAARSFVITR